MNDDKKNANIYLDLLNDIRTDQKETRKCVDNLDKKVVLHIQKTEFELQAINKLDEHQNELLGEHIKGVNTLKTWCDEHAQQNDIRFDKLEAPGNWVKGTVKIATVLTGFGGLGYLIMKIFVGI